MPDIDQSYMRRCIELARKGAGMVAPNPMVGAVLVHDGHIIGEGYHRQYGQPHAEVNCVNSVSASDEKLVPFSTLYVSLEPCAHFGKTPPCSDLIIQKNIPKVVIGCRDPFTEVDGRGIEKLQKAGVEVVTGILEKECKELNKRFLVFVTQKRPYIILKWAQSGDGKIAGNTKERLLITNEYTNRLVHQWRAEEVAILVGTNTALLDDPSLNNRLWKRNNPVRMVLDMSLRLPPHLKIFDQQQRTIIFNGKKQEENNNILYRQINKEEGIVQQITAIAYELGLQSILVEGGTKLLQSFIDAGLWDEARVITNEEMTIPDGLSAPLLNKLHAENSEKISSDNIQYYTNQLINK
ncbi:MAG: bifunctional diaminohydroxyphosphoribosylaminopyrimidine deaminase/5-amino-6-(5-phosphoribosylamino)uracil reductase RibD [Bacteroidota bacterium]